MDNENKAPARATAPQAGQSGGARRRRRRRRGSGNGPRPEQANGAPRQGAPQENAPRQGGRPPRNVRTENAAQPRAGQGSPNNAQGSRSRGTGSQPRPNNEGSRPPRQGQVQQSTTPGQGGGRRPRRGGGNGGQGAGAGIAPAQQAPQQRPARRTPPPPPVRDEDPGLVLISRRPPHQKFASFEEYLEARGGVTAPLPPEPQQTDIGRLRYVALSGSGNRLAQPDDEVVPSSVAGVEPR